MSRTKLALYVLIGLGILTGLLGSHWLAYSKGKASSAQLYDELQRDFCAVQDRELLQQSMLALKVAIKHPEEYSAEDYQLWRSKLRIWSGSVEKIHIPWLEKLGDEQQADELRALIRKAKELDARLARGPRQN